MKLRLMVLVTILLLATSAYAQQPDPQVQFNTSAGSFIVTLDPKSAPKTVANFLDYVRLKSYNNTIFHRVIKGFMVQGGGLTLKMHKKPTNSPVVNEADNGLQNKVGTIAMARTGDPHSATAQFFINVADNAFLDHRGKNPRGWGYCVFGKVTEGMDVVRAIEKVKTHTLRGRKDVPVEPVIIKSAVLITPKNKP